ncbi:sensor histidine kinase [Pseudokineococcus lusitanus]|uniref:histidine kinase n=1 Tax=Pseudokineococcus lusitanus TaxID=763993 RepID=A0A3N1HQM0_9ACTN|nr:ATP-binding protein [Pseudokineococcus lusitanus]ROP44750.1 two-component system OmpR family sensor kinase [Pseudokineococcus lusitanus]
MSRRGRRAGRRPWTLRARLLAGLSAVLVGVLLLTGGVTLLVVDRVLVGQVDQQVRSEVAQAGVGDGPPGPGGPARDQDQPDFLLRGLGVGSLGARVEDGQIVAATLVGNRAGPPQQQYLDADQAAPLAAVPLDEPVTVDVPGLGEYRVAATATDAGSVLVGQPLEPTTTVVRELAVAVLLLAALGILAAVLATNAVLARGLRPLRRVAATATAVSRLPLDRGAVDLPVRVPPRDTDPSTEVGQVGAALDRLIVHVGSALDARHRSETQVRQFVADASHELRTPLASVRGYAELALRRRDDLPPEVAHAVERVESQATRMTGLVEDLLLLARLDAGRPLEREEVELPLLVVEAVSDAQVTGPDHRWVLDLPEGGDDEDDGEALVVPGDAARLHQVLAGLLANARTHTPPGTTVTTRLRAVDGGAEVVVEDDGPGVDPAVLPTVFERFARADTSRSRAAGSTGLGLAIARAVVEAHGGTVGVASRPGRTAFRVVLPGAAAVPPAAPAEVAVSPARGRRRAAPR